MLLTVIGIWPREDTFSNNIKLYIQTAIVFSLMCFLLIPHVIYTYFDCENLTKYMKVIAAQVFSLLAIIKFWTVIINRKEIRFCLNEIEIQYRDVKCEEDRLVMTNCAKIGRFFTTVYLGLSYTGALPYHIILPLISERIVKEDNTTQIPLPYLSDYVFFVIEDSPIYEMTYSALVGECLSIVFLSEMIGCTIIICFLEFGVIMELEDQNTLSMLTYFVLMTSIFVNVFIISFIGDRLIEEVLLQFQTNIPQSNSEKIGKTLYFLPWYDFPEDVAKNVRTIILRTYLPSSLSGAKILNLSLQAFCD
ncbi:unnamed protein product, partial [Heterotrigona itama]